MTNKNFDEIAKEQFKFLETALGLSLIRCRKENWGYELIYLGKITGVKIVYEFQEAYVFVTLYRLINGELIENPIDIKNDTPLHGYGLDDIINLHNPSALIKPVYKYGEKSEYYDKKKGLTMYVAAFANNLKEYASDVLSGHFAIFNELDMIIKRRVNK